MYKRKQFLADKVIIASLSFLWVLLCVGCGGGGGDDGSGGGGAGNIDNPPQISNVRSSVFSDEDAVYSTGRMVRLDIEESSGEADIISGTIRITSATTGYDSGDQDLTFSSIFYNWDTTGLEPANDYVVEVTLVDAVGQETSDDSLIVTLVPNPPAINKLVSQIDISSPAIGIPVSVVRTYLLDSGFNSSLGFGWTHFYLMHVVETGDGLVKVFNSDGSASFYRSNGDGTYDPPKGDFRVLTKNPVGTFQLREKFGTLFRFNAVGKLTGIEDRNGNTIILSYDIDGLLETITDASLQETTFNYDANNRLSAITDPVGRTVSYEYDSDDNLISVTDFGGFVTHYTYDANHNLTTITDPAGRQTFFIIDADDRVKSVSDEGGNNMLMYDYGLPKPDQMTVTDALGNKTILTHDNNALITEIVDPLGNVTSFAYDVNNNMVSLMDANGSTSMFTYDNQGNILTSTDARGKTSMTYDSVFNVMTSLTDAKGNTTTFSYDSKGNQTSKIFPDGSSETFTYDAFGNILSKTDRMNQSIKFVYDFRGLQTAKIFPDGTSDFFAYDAAGNLVGAEDENGTIEFMYDAFDRLIEVNYPGGEVVSYAYDSSNNRTQIAYPDGTILDYEYDEVNRIQQISESSQMIAGYSYDKLSRVIRRDLGNGNFTTSSYDQSGRLLDLINSKSTSEAISSFSYTYDNVGNRLTMTTLAGTTEYLYDNNNQLTQVVLPDGSTIIYNLDPSGNRNSVVVDGITTSYTTSNLNQYTDVGGDTYAYDANGNLTNKTTDQGTSSYSYDFENRIIQVDTPTETIKYSYDPFGRRTSKTTSCCTTNYIYDQNRIIMETDDFGTVQASYIYGIGIDEVLVMNRDGVDYYYARDGLGSVTNLTDFSENIIESFSYDAYGTPSNQSSVGNPYLFTGREFEPEIDMYFYRTRYYNPEIGRFITEDPIGFVAGTNLYTYVSNNPINYIDASGLARLGPPGFNHCTLLRWKCKTFYCNPHYILVVGEADCIACHMELRKKCGSTKRGDPTFIQASQREVRKRPFAHSRSNYDGLFGGISVPCEDALVRGDVPIFGLAYGNNFKEYRVEYGEGEAPTEWTKITSSTNPVTTYATAAGFDDSLDITIRGNLATWDTGLKNYIYLPSHPKNHPINLKGTYTVRLVVTGVDGSTFEDRITVEVANVIPNAFGGQATSKDGHVVLNVPEQAIMDSFRLISIESAKNVQVDSPPERQVIGKMYKANEPGEQFTKEAVLQIAYQKEEIGDALLDQIGIYGYNLKTKEWEYLDSKRDEQDNFVFAKVRKLHAYYALMISEVTGEGSDLKPVLDKRPHIQQTSAIPEYGHTLVKNTFEGDLGEWSNRDNEVGATVTLDNSATFDGTRVAKITNTHVGGNFAVNLITTPYDARAYPLVQFDYRITPEVKTNYLIKVSGRWYDIGFTDDPEELKDKRVNIAHIGDIKYIVSDDQWHTARFNLYDMLRTKTGNTRVEAMIMADWDVDGYMKLVFGKNRKDATYYIDNFMITKESLAGLRTESDTVLVDNFNQMNHTNTLGGEHAVFTDQQRGMLALDFDSETSDGIGRALRLQYDVSAPTSYAGYSSSLQDLDLRGFQRLTFLIKGETNGQDCMIGIRDSAGYESKVVLSRYLPGGMTQKWQAVDIPLVAFAAVKDWGHIDNISFGFERTLSPKGIVCLDDMTFHKILPELKIDDFENADHRNTLGKGHHMLVSGNAAVNGKHTKGSSNGIYRISYGGNIGKINAYASDLKSFAGWRTDLGGVDCSRCQNLTMRVRGAESGENFTIYLGDGNFRWGVDIAQHTKITADWQNITIPLAEFYDYGVDLTHLDELQVVFEGYQMSGTVYLDDLMLGPAKKMAVKN